MQTDRDVRRNSEVRPCIIAEVSTDTQQVIVTDNYGTTIHASIHYNQMPIIVPVVGEAWLIRRQGADWFLDRKQSDGNPMAGLSEGDVAITSTSGIKLVGDTHITGGTTIDGNANINGAFTINGTAPSKFYSGTGVPSNTIGADGDLYLRTSTGVWYYKASGAWTSAPETTAPDYAKIGTFSLDGSNNPLLSFGSDLFATYSVIEIDFSFEHDNGSASSPSWDFTYARPNDASGANYYWEELVNTSSSAVGAGEQIAGSAICFGQAVRPGGLGSSALLRMYKPRSGDLGQMQFLSQWQSIHDNSSGSIRTGTFGGAYAPGTTVTLSSLRVFLGNSSNKFQGGSYATVYGRKG